MWDTALKLFFSVLQIRHQITWLELWEHFTSIDNGEDLFADELLVYKEWKARYEVENEENENREENSRTALDGKLRVFKARLQLSLARIYFVQVWLFY